MHALSTTHPMSKITRLAISQKPVNQKKKSRSGQYIFTPLYWFLGSKLKIPITTEIRQLFGHLGNQHLTAHQTAQW